MSNNTQGIRRGMLFQILAVGYSKYLLFSFYYNKKESETDLKQNDMKPKQKIYLILGTLGRPLPTIFGLII